MTFAQIPEDACRDSWAVWLANREEDQSLPSLNDSEFTRKLKLAVLAKGVSHDQLEAPISSCVHSGASQKVTIVKPNTANYLNLLQRWRDA